PHRGGCQDDAAEQCRYDQCRYEQCRDELARYELARYELARYELARYELARYELALRRMQRGAAVRAVSRGACDLSRCAGRRLPGMGLHSVRRRGDYRPARARVRPRRQCRQGRLSTKNPARIPKNPGEPGGPVLFPASASGTAFNPVTRVKHGVSA